MAGMNVIRQIAVVVWILPWLVSGCASPTKSNETHMIQIASYKDSDEAVATLVLHDIHEHDILFGGAGGGGYMCIEVFPNEADQARKLLRRALSRLSPEQREHSLKVFGP
jgi:hypothetical protein